MKISAHAATSAAVALGFVWPAYGQVTTSHQIPYQGRLELDGVPMNGAFDFQFDLYTSDTLGDCGVPAVISGYCVWADELPGVDVAAGNFSITLGSTANPLGDAIWQNVEVYLGVRVAASGDTYTQLTGRQRILAVPMAARAETAKNYRVTGTLAVGGAATFSSTASVSGSLTTHGILPLYQNWGSTGVGDGGAGIYNDAGTYDRLMVIGNTAAGGTTRRVGIGDDLFVSQHLDVGGRFLPDFESIWTAVTGAFVNEVVFNHDFGAIPSQVMLQQCGAIAGSGASATCTTRVVLAGQGGYQDGSWQLNPVRLTADNNNIYVGMTVWWAWGYWTPGGNWGYTGDADDNPYTGYYKILAWR